MKIIGRSRIQDAKSQMNNFLETFGDKQIENLIVVFLTDGFCYEDGEVILFEDGAVLLDTFIEDIIAVEAEKRKCKVSHFDFEKLTFFS